MWDGDGDDFEVLKNRIYNYFLSCIFFCDLFDFVGLTINIMGIEALFLV